MRGVPTASLAATKQIVIPRVPLAYDNGAVELALLEAVPVNQSESGKEQTAEGEVQTPSVRRQALGMQLGYHLVALVASVALWGAMDVWSQVSQLGVAQFFAVLGSIVFGIAMAHVLHEWSHFLGALLSGSHYAVKEMPAFLFFDFDFVRNSARQFQAMSVAGSIGNLFFIAAVFLCLPLDTMAREILCAVAVGMAAFVAVIEWPVIRRVVAGKSPIDALTERFSGSNFYQHAVAAGGVSALATWLLL